MREEWTVDVVTTLGDRPSRAARDRMDELAHKAGSVGSLVDLVRSELLVEQVTVEMITLDLRSNVVTIHCADAPADS